MYPSGYNYSHATQGHASIAAYASPAPGYTSNATHAATPGHPIVPAPAPVPGPVTRPPSVTIRTPSPPTLVPVPVPPGYHPIELTQFWRDEYKRGQPFPLHWALFVRTLPHSAKTPARGNFYEIVGSEETHTAQFLHNVTFEPGVIPDWRGTHVIGWVSPGHMGVFEGVVRQVRVWRHRADWRSQHWVYDVASAVGCNYQGMFMDSRVTFGGLQKHMGKLLDAWESGDI